MTVLAIVLLILLGILLLLLEFFVVPGVTIAGLGGVLSIGVGVFLAYYSYNSTIGHLTLLSAVILCVLTVVISLKSKTWNKISLKSTIESKANTIEEHSVTVGDKGVTISRLAPMGKISVNNNFFEAKSKSGFIDENTSVVVVKIDGSKLIVEKS